MVSGLVFLVLPDEFRGTCAARWVLSIVVSPFCLAGVPILPEVVLEVSVKAGELLSVWVVSLLPLPHAASPTQR